jgi:hypothetical protein
MRERLCAKRGIEMEGRLERVCDESYQPKSDRVLEGPVSVRIFKQYETISGTIEDSPYCSFTGKYASMDELKSALRSTKLTVTLGSDGIYQIGKVVFLGQKGKPSVSEVFGCISFEEPEYTQ